MASLLNPVLVLNADTSVRYVNPAWECLTGFTQGEVIGIRAPYPWWPEGAGDSYLRRLKAGMREGSGITKLLFAGRAGSASGLR